ncbi:hypothetical protein [uncultured Deefgea sp.]|uniref:hypothetical protein n=1 Tax=uncultured Deefgea sp. TaxID=1304914 RepID=UPI002605E360|nr:hypothetical protein [uncultured Deefgea sp.]
MLPMKDIIAIVSFGQYLHWAQMQYDHYQSFTESSSDADFVGALAHWLASLYVVVEGWQELEKCDPAISNLISKYDDYYQLIRRFRNAVYHFQPKPMSEKITDFLGTKSEGHAWSYALLFEFKRFLVLTVPDDAIGEEMKLAIGWWPKDFLVLVKAVRGDIYGEINPAMNFLSRISQNA